MNGDRPLRILTLTAVARGGGAEWVARTVGRALEHEPGFESHIRVQAGQPEQAPLVSAVPFRYDQMSLAQRTRCYLRSKCQIAGMEQFASESSRHVLDRLPFEPDVIHAHNIRVDLTRLEDLPRLARRTPIVWTLHDMWPLTGHCTHAFECGRWKTGCGRCPHLEIPVELRRDLSRLNLWRRKRIYRRIAQMGPGQRIHLVSPSRWLANLAAESVTSVFPIHVIPNGIDLRIFTPPTPERKAELRRRWEIPQDQFVVLFTGHWGSRNPFKDFQTFEQAAVSLRERKEILFVCVGDEQPLRNDPANPNLARMGTMHTEQAMAEAYQAADLYVHATRADNLPLTIMEAMGCGLPVVGSQVGGVGEMIENGRTGALVPAGEAEALSQVIDELSQAPQRCQAMGEAGRQRAQLLYGLERMIQDYKSLYRKVWNENHPGATTKR